MNHTVSFTNSSVIFLDFVQYEIAKYFKYNKLRNGWY